MNSSVLNGSVAKQPASPDRRAGKWSGCPDHDELGEIRSCLSARGWNYEALSAHMGGKDASYLRKVLEGEKPMPAGFLDDLPRDAMSLYHAQRAEHHGHIVVAPVDEETARRYFAIAVLSGHSMLPSRAAHMAKAATATDRTKKEIA